MSEVQTIKTLLHEMAHEKLHDKDNVPEAKDISRNGKEVEALYSCFYNIDLLNYFP